VSDASFSTYPSAPARSAARHECRLLVHRQHDDLRVRRFCTQLGNRLQARAAQHVEIKQQHVWMVLALVAPSRIDAADLSHDTKSGSALSNI
jgi:hypothetical protein